MANYLEGILSIRDLPLENKRVFIRVDFNVPLEDGRRSPTTRACGKRCRRSSTPWIAARA